MKAALPATLMDSNLADCLPWDTLGPCSTPKMDLQLAELIFGQLLRVPGEFLLDPSVLATTIHHLVFWDAASVYISVSPCHTSQRICCLPATCSSMAGIVFVCGLHRFLKFVCAYSECSGGLCGGH